MSNALLRIIGAGTLVLALFTVVAAPGQAKDRTNSNGKHALDRATGGDRAQNRMSAQGLANSNGIFMPGRAAGRDHLDDRMNRHGLDNGKAGKHADRNARHADRSATKHADWDAKHADRQTTHAVAASTAPGRGRAK
ncbi:MAG: hypothetical protein Q8M19_01645 [Reyranella sp.]|nr:hypothetical protein [Reyranella sp.]